MIPEDDATGVPGGFDETMDDHLVPVPGEVLTFFNSVAAPLGQACRA